MINLLKHYYELIQNPILYQLTIAALIVLCGFLIAKIFSLLLKKIIQPYVKKTETHQDDKLISVLQKTIFRVTVIGAFYFASEIFGSSSLFLIGTESDLLTTRFSYLDEINLAVSYILYIILIVVLMISAFKIVTIGFDWYAESVNAGDNRNLSGSLFPLLKKISKVLIVILAVVIVLSKFDVNISGLIVSLGVGSLAIALAAQETLSNMIAGFTIMIDRPFRIGDRIRFSQNQVGDVVEIGIRTTKILDFDNNLVIVPNNEIVKTIIVNLTYPNTSTRVVIDFMVAYGTDLKKVKYVLTELWQQEENIEKDKSPEISLINFNDSSLGMRMTFFTGSYKQAWDLQTRMREKIYQAFAKEGIEMPFPQRVIQIVNPGTLK
ncbi:MAG: mechanosensitive ion channel family protein [Ignavibacteriaceae bacterium]|nr:mechanosensitive ion channel family protein [Ignavibacteriaceae bacterium]